MSCFENVASVLMSQIVIRKVFVRKVFRGCKGGRVLRNENCFYLLMCDSISVKLENCESLEFFFLLLKFRIKKGF